MSSLMIEMEQVSAVCLSLDDEVLNVELDDGRSLSIPISWYPRLLYGTSEERENYRFIGDGSGIHWPELDEDISIQGLLAGHHSQESQRSLDKWLKTRN